MKPKTKDEFVMFYVKEKYYCIVLNNIINHPPFSKQLRIWFGINPFKKPVVTKRNLDRLNSLLETWLFFVLKYCWLLVTRRQSVSPRDGSVFIVLALQQCKNDVSISQVKNHCSHLWCFLPPWQVGVIFPALTTRSFWSSTPKQSELMGNQLQVSVPFFIQCDIVLGRNRQIRQNLENKEMLVGTALKRKVPGLQVKTAKWNSVIQITTFNYCVELFQEIYHFSWLLDQNLNLFVEISTLNNFEWD